MSAPPARLARLRRNYEDVCLFAFEQSEVWRTHCAAGRAAAASEAEREYRVACREATEFGARLREIEMVALMSVAGIAA